MRAYVFTDPTLTRQAGRYVWLALDTEKAGNAALRKRLQVNALPSFFVLDPATEKVAIRWVGGMSVAQVQRMMDDGETRVAHRAGSAWQTALARADALYGEANYAAAVPAYRTALASAPRGFTGESRAVESLLFALSETDSAAACAMLAREMAPRARHTASAGNVIASGLDCAVQMSKDDPRRAALLDTLERAARDVAADTALAIAADDRSAVYIALLDARDAAGDSVGHQATAGQWAAFLERAAARAKTPEQRAVFDSHRLSAYLELNAPERAIPMLEASERDLPNDYNPPARLATAYKAMHRWDDALAASDRALAKAYGPRRMLVLQTRADIYLGKGDRAGARRTLEQALAEARAFPEGQRSERTISALEKKVAELQDAAQR